MYNPQKIITLLESGGIKKRELLEYLGKNWNGSVESIIKGDIRVSKLEKIADFFGVPVDTFFDREVSAASSVSVGGIKNRVHNFSIGTSSENAALKTLIDEKDKRIKLLEEMVEILKSQSSKS